MTPVKGYKQAYYTKGDVTQFFGENVSLYAAAVPGLTKGHNGIDIVRPWGEDIYSVKEGIVVDVKNDATGYGKHVRVLCPVRTGIFQEWTYGHLSSINVTVGQSVTDGQKLGEMGNTGFVVSGSTPFWKFNPYAGTHLHIGLRILKEKATGWKYYAGAPACEVLDYDNGFLGAVDPRPYLSQEIVDSVSEEIKKVNLTLQSIINNVLDLLN